MTNDSPITIFGIAILIIGGLVALFMCCNFVCENIDKVNEHHAKIRRECKLVRRISGDYVTYNTVDGKGNVGMTSSYTPGKECYLCPNGVEECL